MHIEGVEINDIKCVIKYPTEETRQWNATSQIFEHKQRELPATRSTEEEEWRVEEKGGGEGGERMNFTVTKMTRIFHGSVVIEKL